MSYFLHFTKKYGQLSFFLLAACLLLTGCLTQQDHPSSDNGQGKGSPRPTVWVLQPQQTLRQSPQGTFYLPFIRITPRELQFFYAFSAHKHGKLHVEAASTAASTSTASTPLATTLQPLGQIEEFSISVLHIAYLDRAGQFITLRITLPGESSPTWSLSPLQQIIKEPLPGDAFYAFPSQDPGAFPPIAMELPLGKGRAGYVRKATSMLPLSRRSYVFFQAADASQVRVLTKAEYLSLTGTKSVVP
ncbi:MAG: hypothetical protein ABI456_05985 [Ktedonobacteraceae bacterium]